MVSGDMHGVSELSGNLNPKSISRDARELKVNAGAKVHIVCIYGQRIVETVTLVKGNSVLGSSARKWSLRPAWKFANLEKENKIAQCPNHQRIDDGKN
ncbi:MAG: hypothetical protein JNN07_03655 [Verrucomicrobiales bacterium]|nr:hypothetical protein [Verrucomicrobiales bacterium]